MRSPCRYFLILLLCTLLAVPMGTAAEADANNAQAAKLTGRISMSQLPPPSNDTTPGSWFLGATPPNYDPNKPPIVFVQGMNGRAQDWWDETMYHGLNDMYEKAYSHGYRTAFVQLYDAAGQGSASQWDNGRLLAYMLEQIYHRFGQKVNIVAHSKGGPDTQAALIHYGAYRFVGKVVTLGSPHHGSHLADLAHSWYAGWLAELLGIQSPGTYSLQTGEMAKFREVTDSHANVGQNAYYTAAGTSWGPFPSALWTGGLYLSPHGPNDGLVNEWSTRLRYGSHLFTDDVDHDMIRTGSASFSRIEPVLRTSRAAGAAPKAMAPPSEAVAVPQADEQYVYGAALHARQTVEHQVPVDSSSREALFTIMTRSPDAEVILISPSGGHYSKAGKEYLAAVDRGLFAGAYVQAFRIQQPQRGVWKVRITSPRDDAFLLTTTFVGSSTLSVDLPLTSKQKDFAFKVKLRNPAHFDPSSLQVRLKGVTPREKAGRLTNSARFQQQLKMDSKQLGAFVGKISTGLKPGAYNLTIEIKGKTKRGEPFARTVVRSVHIDN
ncbi:esterase/lipase family protein [Lihuaxuella thermophila]|uniref:Triacylglycerol esterase/lipase EstA, alpha/beta hydrolase fold n=1 Tax=Lihuaxuella thermophila TaxID=1173111 RepID=A0A1H8C7C5_9BACL|nr:hypothetical protein [Lihuaxuella thermophila]SEM90940.1 hypothetical protein SAMN05444955_103117 [Lihuaxuella thermophila]